MKFGIKNLCPSISEHLLERALKLACRFTIIFTATTNTNKHCRKFLRFSKNSTWVKKDQPKLDVTVASFVGAKIQKLWWSSVCSKSWQTLYQKNL